MYEIYIANNEVSSFFEYFSPKNKSKILQKSK